MNAEREMTQAIYVKLVQVTFFQTDTDGQIDAITAIIAVLFFKKVAKNYYYYLYIMPS